jgi:hypothetical protein
VQGVKLGLWATNEEKNKKTWPRNANNNWREKGEIHAGFWLTKQNQT